MSIVIVAFKGAPTVDAEAVKKEEELDKRIEDKIKGSQLFKMSHNLHSVRKR